MIWMIGFRPDSNLKGGKKEGPSGRKTGLSDRCFSVFDWEMTGIHREPGHDGRNWPGSGELSLRLADGVDFTNLAHRSRTQESIRRVGLLFGRYSDSPDCVRLRCQDSERPDRTRGSRNAPQKHADQIHPIVEWNLGPQSVATETRRWARHEVILLLSLDNRCAFSRSCDEARVRPAQKRTISKRIGGWYHWYRFCIELVLQYRFHRRQGIVWRHGTC